MKEVFKNIIGYENLYQISESGVVKSLPKGDGNGNRERILKTDKTKTNGKGIPYLRVSLSKQGKVKRYSVHQLVANHFLEPDKDRAIVNHIDGNPSNNHYSNLEWCTGAENMQHAYITGLSTHAQKLASEAASKLNNTKMKLRFEESIRDRLLNIEIVGKRRWVTYLCASCNNTYKHRSDNPSVKRGGVCRGCYIKKKI